MFKRTLLFLFITLSGLNVFATHYRGAEITYRVIGNYQIEATVTTYTKYSGQSTYADRDSVTINWGDGYSSILPRVNGANDGTCTGASPCGVNIATANNVLHIQTSLQCTGIIVSDMLGRNVLSIQNKGISYDVPVNQLPNGVYIVNISMPGAAVIKKFIKAG